MTAALVVVLVLAGVWCVILVEHAAMREWLGVLRCLFWVAFYGMAAFLAWRALPVCS